MGGSVAAIVGASVGGASVGGMAVGASVTAGACVSAGAWVGVGWQAVRIIEAATRNVTRLNKNLLFIVGFLLQN